MIQFNNEVPNKERMFRTNPMVTDEKALEIYDKFKLEIPPCEEEYFHNELVKLLGEANFNNPIIHSVLTYCIQSERTKHNRDNVNSSVEYLTQQYLNTITCLSIKTLLEQNEALQEEMKQILSQSPRSVYITPEGGKI